MAHGVGDMPSALSERDGKMTPFGIRRRYEWQPERPWRRLTALLLVALSAAGFGYWVGRDGGVIDLPSLSHASLDLGAGDGDLRATWRSQRPEQEATRVGTTGQTAAPETAPLVVLTHVPQSRAGARSTPPVEFQSTGEHSQLQREATQETGARASPSRSTLAIDGMVPASTTLPSLQESAVANPREMTPGLTGAQAAQQPKRAAVDASRSSTPRRASGSASRQEREREVRLLRERVFRE